MPLLSFDNQNSLIFLKQPDAFNFIAHKLHRPRTSLAIGPGKTKPRPSPHICEGKIRASLGHSNAHCQGLISETHVKICASSVVFILFIFFHPSVFLRPLLCARYCPLTGNTRPGTAIC